VADPPLKVKLLAFSGQGFLEQAKARSDSVSI
jgi:hypothetical protein